jgi:hypothetical protein
MCYGFIFELEFVRRFYAIAGLCFLRSNGRRQAVLFRAISWLILPRDYRIACWEIA